MSRTTPAAPSEVGEAVSRQHLQQWKLGMAATGAIALVSAAGILFDADAGRSALLAAVLVGVLFSASSLALAAAAKRNPDGVVLLGLGLYVIKVFVIALLLLSAPRPEWLRPVPAALAGIAAVLAWQWALIRSSKRARLPLYAPQTAEDTRAGTSRARNK